MALIAAHGSPTAARQGDRTELRLTRGYVQLSAAPPDLEGAKTVSLARFGHYDVRLVEFVPASATDPTPIWLELYSHETQCAISWTRHRAEWLATRTLSPRR